MKPVESALLAFAVICLIQTVCFASMYVSVYLACSIIVVTVYKGHF